MIRSNYPPIHSNGSPSDRGGIIFDLDLHTPETLAVSPPQYEISSLGRPYETFPNYVPLPKACCGSNIVVVGIVVGMMMMILYHFLFHLLHLKKKLPKSWKKLNQISASIFELRNQVKNAEEIFNTQWLFSVLSSFQIAETQNFDGEQTKNQCFFHSAQTIISSSLPIQAQLSLLLLMNNSKFNRLFNRSIFYQKNWDFFQIQSKTLSMADRQLKDKITTH